MLRLFLKSTIRAKSILSDFWVILIISFIFSFILLFSRSMLETLDSINRSFVSSDFVLEKKDQNALNSDIFEKCKELKNYDDNLAVDITAAKAGIIENNKFFAPIALKVVTPDFWNTKRIIEINLEPNSENIFKTSNSKGLILSKKFLKKHSLNLNDRVAFLASDSIRAELLNICASFETGMSEFDENLGFWIVDNDMIVDNFKDNITISINLKKESSFKLYPRIHKLNSDYAKMSDVYDKSREVFSDFFVKEGDVNSILARSLGSIKFLLYLFNLISILYLGVAIKNFINRNSARLGIFIKLGLRHKHLYLLISLLLTTFLATGVAIVISAFLVSLSPVILNFLNSHNIVNFGYYITNFHIDVLNFDLVIYIVVNLVFILFWFLIFKVFENL